MKCHHFDVTAVIEAESQAVLNTLTEYDFLDTFRNVNGENCAYARKGTTSIVKLAVGLKSVFDQMPASVPKIMDGFLYT
jgi:hypothetical protein